MSQSIARTRSQRKAKKEVYESLNKANKSFSTWMSRPQSVHQMQLDGWVYLSQKAYRDCSAFGPTHRWDRALVFSPVAFFKCITCLPLSISISLSSSSSTEQAILEPQYMKSAFTVLRLPRHLILELNQEKYNTPVNSKHLKEWYLLPLISQKSEINSLYFASSFNLPHNHF